MKKIVSALFSMLIVFLLSCNNDLPVRENIISENDINDFYTSCKFLFLQNLEDSAATRSVVTEDINSAVQMDYEEFLVEYVNTNEEFAIHYNSLIDILKNEDISVELTIQSIQNYVSSIMGLDENTFQRLQICAASIESTLLFFSDEDTLVSRGVYSWLKKRKSRIINAAISGVCGALIGAAGGACVGAVIPVIGYVPGAVIGAVTYGVVAASEGYKQDTVYITSGEIKL